MSGIKKMTGKDILLTTVITVILLGLDFLLTAGILRVICWAFNWVWSWKFSIGIWCIEMFVLSILRTIFKINK